MIRPGRVTDADRDGFIAAAEALVFPSEYEGFGAPVLEAMSLGTPVVCSDRAALPEVAGDAALVRPLTVEAWATALDEVAAHRDELAAAGRRRAAWFTTKGSGARLAEAYRLAAGGAMSDERPLTTHRSSRRLRLVILGPHFEPDTAPTGRVLTRIVHELAARGHELHVVAALPWYREHAVEPAWTGRLVRRRARPVGVDPPRPSVSRA